MKRSRAAWKRKFEVSFHKEAAAFVKKEEGKIKFLHRPLIPLMGDPDTHKHFWYPKKCVTNFFFFLLVTQQKYLVVLPPVRSGGGKSFISSPFSL